jgi:hypothetical protein
LSAKDGLSEQRGFFRFGRDVVAYGKYAGHAPAESARGPLLDAWQEADCESDAVRLPFDLDGVVENPEMER